MPRPNWFFAFPVKGDFVLEIPAPPTSFRRFHPEDVHMTLAFLGGCEEAAARRALGVLDERLRGTPLPAFGISLGDVVPMGGSARSYSALSALLIDGRDTAVSWIASLRDDLTETATGRRDERPPKPHVTIARPRQRAKDPERAAGLAWASALDLRGVRATLDRVALYTWNAQRRDRLFEIREERALPAD
jgi:2'-5' RNA ligase